MREAPLEPYTVCVRWRGARFSVPHGRTTRKPSWGRTLVAHTVVVWLCVCATCAAHDAARGVPFFWVDERRRFVF